MRLALVSEERNHHAGLVRVKSGLVVGLGLSWADIIAERKTSNVAQMFTCLSEGNVTQYLGDACDLSQLAQERCMLLQEKMNYLVWFGVVLWTH